MASIQEVIESTLKVLELVEVRGKNNRNALSVVVDNLEAIAAALKESKNQGGKMHGDDGDDKQG